MRARDNLGISVAARNLGIGHRASKSTPRRKAGELTGRHAKTTAVESTPSHTSSIPWDQIVRKREQPIYPVKSAETI